MCQALCTHHLINPVTSPTTTLSLNLIVHISYQRDLPNVTRTIKLESGLTPCLSSSNKKPVLFKYQEPSSWAGIRGIYPIHYVATVQPDQEFFLPHPMRFLLSRLSNVFPGSSQMTPSGLGKATAPVSGTSVAPREEKTVLALMPTASGF